MRIYTVHERAGAPADGEGLVFVREGFSWEAFVFTFLWLVFQRLWLALVVYIVVVLAAAAAAAAIGLSPAGMFAVSFALHFLLACEANDIRRRALASRGYPEIAIASGRTLVEAERDFFRRWQGPSVSATAATRAPSRHGAVWPRRDEDREPIGLFPKAGG
jgi:hypothetical protein